jgi:hypothetical protein
MKNIHLLPTDKPSRLFLKENTLLLNNQYTLQKIFTKGKCQNIYITSDEEIKEGDWIINLEANRISKADFRKDILKSYIAKHFKKVILSTDQDLINNGIQAIDDTFLEWFVKNPSCESVEVKHKNVVQYGNMTMYDHNGDGSYYFCTNCEVETSKSKKELLKFGVEYYKIIIPQEEPKQETIEEPDYDKIKQSLVELRKQPMSFVLEEKMYSEKDLREAFFSGCQSERQIKPRIKCWEEWFKQFKKK